MRGAAACCKTGRLRKIPAAPNSLQKSAPNNLQSDNQKTDGGLAAEMTLSGKWVSPIVLKHQVMG
jgi:hypothetical protein